MKGILPILFLLSSFVISCVEKADRKTTKPSVPVETVDEIPDTTVDISLLHYDNKTSQWTLDTLLYSGHAVSYYQDGVLKEKISFLSGRKQNQATQWFADKHLKRILNYHRGKLHGEKKSWSPDGNHILLSHLHYQMGKAHGTQTFWYPTGELYKKLTLNMGREEGMQQAFRKNGELYANYEARNGRIFGLKKAALCYGLEDEEIQYEE